MTALMLLNICTGVLIHTLPFFEAIPDYECRQPDGAWVSCKREHICGQELVGDQWRINYQSPSSMNNFVDPSYLDLTCKSGTLIGLIGSAYFIGFAAACVFIPRLSDIYGRRVIFIFFMWLQTISYVLIFYSRSVQLTILYFGIIGICQPARLIVTTMIMCEYSLEKFMPVLTSCIHASDTIGAVTFILLLTSLGDIIPFFKVLLVFSGIINILILLVPESAKFYLANHRYQEARSALYFIARVNRSKVTKAEVDSIVFDVEVKNQAKKGVEASGSLPSDDVTNNEQPRASANTIRLEGKLREIV